MQLSPGLLDDGFDSLIEITNRSREPRDGVNHHSIVLVGLDILEKFVKPLTVDISASRLVAIGFDRVNVKLVLAVLVGCFELPIQRLFRSATGRTRRPSCTGLLIHKV